MEDGNQGIKIQLARELLCANGETHRLPLKYESEGIKKITSILHLLIAAYNNPSITLAIDELDSGIYEYLLGELLPASPYLEDRIYRELIRRSNKSVIERIRMLEDEQNDYRDYIESWVHEIKAPITSIQLVCENHKDEVTRQISLENQRIENDVDMVLYYARMEKVYKDYMIEETDLGKAASEILIKNKYYLISNGVRGEVECPDLAYTDKKWILFILNQLMLNSVKYKSENPKVHPYIHIYTERYGHGVRLIVEDNGTGIREEEMSRIFEKGFTGSNGRNGKKSTGMGLYLCRRLCEKLGIAIEAESVRGEGTKMILTFPVSSYLSKM